MKDGKGELREKTILVVYSPDGGNGKSEIAANLAYSLANSGLMVWVLDSNVFAPSQDMIFSVSPDGSAFPDFLLGHPSLETYDITSRYVANGGGSLFLTPSRSSDSSARSRVRDAVDKGRDIYHRIPGAVMQAMDENGTDLLIVDTHPGFEPVNQVWLALAGLLLVVSRLHDIDLKNLKTLLLDPDVADIVQKLVVFNNVQLDANRQPSRTYDNREFVDRMFSVERREEFRAYISDCEDPPCRFEGMTEIYHQPFLYSEKLARFGEDIPRKGLFIQREPSDPFSINIGHLSGHILRGLK